MPARVGNSRASGRPAYRRASNQAVAAQGFDNPMNLRELVASNGLRPGCPNWSKTHWFQSLRLCMSGCSTRFAKWSVTLSALCYLGAFCCVTLWRLFLLRAEGCSDDHFTWETKRTTRLFWKGLGLPHQFFEESNPLQR